MSNSSPDSRTARCPSASTVAILREAPTGFEVLMVQRHTNSRFMADRFVYLGGKLDLADCILRAAQRIDGRTPAEIQAAFGPLSLRQSADSGAEAGGEYLGSGLFLAGIRETFEEAGILLARRKDQPHLIDLTSDAAVAERFRTYRQKLNRGTLALSTSPNKKTLSSRWNASPISPTGLPPFTNPNATILAFSSRLPRRISARCTTQARPPTQDGFAPKTPSKPINPAPSNSLRRPCTPSCNSPNSTPPKTRSTGQAITDRPRSCRICIKWRAISFCCCPATPIIPPTNPDIP